MKPPSAWQPRFTLTTMMLLMLVCCVMSAGAYYMVEGLRSGWTSRLRFLLFVVAAPLCTVTVISFVRLLLDRIRRGK